jgi:hypothetical protein
MLQHNLSCSGDAAAYPIMFWLCGSIPYHVLAMLQHTLSVLRVALYRGSIKTVSEKCTVKKLNLQNLDFQLWYF